MKKKIIVIILVIAVIIGGCTGLYFYFNKSDVPMDQVKLLRNKMVSKEHCEKNICFNNLKIVKALNADMVVFSGYIENKTDETIEPDVEFIFDVGDKKRVYKMEFQSIEGFDKQFFEYQTTDDNLMNTKDYALRLS